MHNSEGERQVPRNIIIAFVLVRPLACSVYSQHIMTELKSPPVEEAPPTDPKRVRAFAQFFKNYMSISALVTAALPIPITALRLIPTYKAQTGLLSVYTTLFCFLVLGFIFFSRHSLGRLLFLSTADHGPLLPTFRMAQRLAAILPALLIVMSLVCVFSYHNLLNNSVQQQLGRPAIFERSIRGDGETNAAESVQRSRFDTVLLYSELWDIPLGTLLLGVYLGTFVFAEAAFILMAIREYLQDLLKLSEMELILGPKYYAAGYREPKKRIS